MRSETGVYLHLPFCLSKCSYCDFASFPLASVGGGATASRYLNAVSAELDRRAASEEFAGATVPTIYLGGGTPTLLPAESLVALLDRIRLRFEVAPQAEISAEANPGTLGREKLLALRAAGFSRLSLGVQSFRDDELRLLGRVHSAAEAAEAIPLARRAGFDNVGLDLIYGLPGQRPEDWEASLDRALALSPEHISAYGLSLEEGTPLEAAVSCGDLPEPDEDVYAAMFELADARLTAAGYEHYEVSNFSRPGRACLHNRRYWSGDEYLGVGSSAHSHRRGVRWNNLPDPAVYCEWVERGAFPVARAEALSARSRLGELLILGLRTAEGVSAEALGSRCGVAPREVFGDAIDRLVAQGLLVETGGRLAIPREKWLVSNEVLSEFAA